MHRAQSVLCQALFTTLRHPPSTFKNGARPLMVDAHTSTTYGQPPYSRPLRRTQIGTQIQHLT
eukprot:scaffold91122_cov64-Phaeocystis_antarctica.AAC.2